jgi:tRNA (guanine10-N2)-methyltransferase
LCYFLHRLLDYRLPEVEALAKLYGFSEGEKPGQGLQWKQAPAHHPDSPFYYVFLPNEEVAHKIVSRSLLLKGMYEVWGEGNSKEELIEAVSSYPEERKAPYLAKDHTFKIVVDRFGKVLSSSEQKACIESIDYVPFQVYTLLYFCFFLMLFFFKIALEEDGDFSILMSYFVSLAPCSYAPVLF